MKLFFLLVSLITSSNCQKYSIDLGTRVFSLKQYHSSAQQYGSMYYQGSTKHIGSAAIRNSATHHYSYAIRGSTKTNYQGSTKTNYQGSTKTNYQGSTKTNYGSMKFHDSMEFHGSSKSNYHGSAKLHGSAKQKGSSFINAFSPTISPTESLPEVFQPPPPTFKPTKSIVIVKYPPTSQSVPGFEVPEIPLTIQIQEGGQQDAPPNQSGRLLKTNIQRLTPDILTTSISKSTGLATKSITYVQIIYETNSVNFTYIIQTFPQSNKYAQYKSIINSLGNLSQSIKAASNHTISINITHFYVSAFSPDDSINSSGQQSAADSLNIAYYFMSSILIVIVGLGAYYFRKRKQLEPSIGAPTISPFANRTNNIEIDDIPKRLSLSTN